MAGDTRFGFATHFAQGWVVNPTMANIASTGVGWIRDDINAGNFETSPGVYIIPAFDGTWINAAHANGLKVCGILGPNGNYSNNYDPTAMANLSVFLVNNGLVDALEVLNEPNNAYQAYVGSNWETLLPILTTTVTNAVTAVSSTVPVIGLGAQGSQITTMLPSTTLNGVDYHPYDSGNFIPETVFEPPFSTYATWIASLNASTSLPFWETEWGSDTGVVHTQVMQAGYIARRLLLASAFAVDHSFIYEFKDNNSSDTFGVEDVNYVAKTAYATVKNIVASLNGVVGNSAQATASSVTISIGSTSGTNTPVGFAYLYTGTNKAVVSFWLGNNADSSPPSATTCSLSFPNSIGFSDANVYDPIAGTSVPLDNYTTSLSSGILTVSGLPITDHPQLIQIMPNIPTLVQHVSTGMDNLPVAVFTVPLPNAALSGNLLILSFQCNSAGTISTVKDNLGNSFTAGPTTTGSSKRIACYYMPNVTSGVIAAVITFSGLTATIGCPHAVLSEWYNVATTSPVDGTSVASGSSKTAGTITTTVSGDLVYQWGTDLSDNASGGNFNGTSITQGSGYTLLSADLQIGSVEQFQVTGSSGAISPAFTTSGAATWGSLAIAFKSAAAGTAPAAGIRVIGAMTTSLAGGTGTTFGTITINNLQFPSFGNLLVASYQSFVHLISGITDSSSNTWTIETGEFFSSNGQMVSQICFAANATTSPTLHSIDFSFTGTAGFDVVVLYDVTGAATSPFDTLAGNQNQQTSNGNLATVSITPSTSNGLIITNTVISFNTINGITPTGSVYVSDTVVNSLDDNNTGSGATEPSALCQDGGYAHAYNTSTSSLTFTYTVNEANSAGGTAGVDFWSAQAVAFKAGVAPSTFRPDPVGSSISSSTSVVPARFVDRALVTRF